MIRIADHNRCVVFPNNTNRRRCINGWAVMKVVTQKSLYAPRC
jgi:hypothetical protein